MVKSVFLTLLLLGLTSCSKFKGRHGSAVAEDQAAFLKTQGSYCTVENSGQPVEDPIDRYDEVFVFGQDNTLRVNALDLDSEDRPQFNSKGQPKIKEVEKATFRVSGEKLFFKSDGASREREATLKRTTRSRDGKESQCFELSPGPSVHCACALPEKI